MKVLNKKESVAITTLGCRSNQYDTSAIEELLTVEGYDLVHFSEHADVYIINTCTVTNKTDYQSRQLIRKVRKINAEAVIIVTGCYAQVSADEVSKIDGVDHVLGNPDKAKIIDCIVEGRSSEGSRSRVSDYKAGTPFTLRAAAFKGRTRANLKIQDGCNRKCAFCIIPMARGVSKSVKEADVLREIEAMVQTGFKEIVFTGIHLGAFGADQADKSLTTLLREVVKEKFPMRVRLSSLDPDEVTDELIELIGSSDSICNHLHLPIQSGDDKILKLMRRPYSTVELEEKIMRVYNGIKDVSIGTDVIGGFPGEGEAEFNNTLALLKELPFSYMHVFPYSKRDGTVAALMPDHLNGKIIKERCAKMREVDMIKCKEFHESYIGKNLKVLFESKVGSDGRIKGRSGNYITAFMEKGNVTPGDKGELLNVKVCNATEEGVFC
ncbi:MAG: tRNA (N(6)-L-threonylcarbamoyladenosine(37)-C(2))-methylthiotransferase MtaB [Deltaproteobacteria bacterium]|nr:tRNA (N(6)-L-threonylcarbamoyladenosine(37)-C(2))-methylthiotransferase MtaB [Deltaproteobacteria bacterium]